MSQHAGNNPDLESAEDAGFAPNANQLPKGDSDFTDGSGALFSMYLKRAEEEDDKMVESWKGDADGLLFFTGLFSAAVAALLAVSVPLIQQSSQDSSAYYLAHIYQQLSPSSNVTIPSSLSDPAAPFTAPTWAVWVNLLWFLSLVISLTCALLATLLQQWARRYQRVAYPPYSPHKRARIRAFYSEGVDKLHMQYTVDALPILLHISLFLFFAGLVVFLFNVNLTIFKAVIVWVGLCVIGYAILTFLPIVYKDSPYAAPLSVLVSFCLTGLRSAFFQFLRRFTRLDPSRILVYRDRDSRTVHLDAFFSRSMRETAEKFALEQDPEIDHRALSWTFESLDEDKELEKFFEGIPGLCSSEALPNASLGFIKPREKLLSNALIGLMNRTLSSNLVHESVKQRRIIICTKAIEATSLLGPWWILDRVLKEWHRFLGCVEFALFVNGWKKIVHPVTIFYAQCVAAFTIWTVRERDERWLKLATGQLNVSKSRLQNYLAHGDSVLLANVMFIVRRTVQTYSGSLERHRNDILAASSKTLEMVCKLNIHHTLPELQHEFCTLWDQLVDTAQTSKHPHVVLVCTATLKNIRKLYIALHKGTSASPPEFLATTDDGDSVLDKAASYPTCTIAGHRPSPSQHVPHLQLDDPPPTETIPAQAAGQSTVANPALHATAQASAPQSTDSTTDQPPQRKTPPPPFPTPTHQGSFYTDSNSQPAAASPSPGAPVNFPSAQTPVTPTYGANVAAVNAEQNARQDAQFVHASPSPSAARAQESNMGIPLVSLPASTSPACWDNKSTSPPPDASGEYANSSQKP